MHEMSSSKGQRGFTFVEMALALILLSLISIGVGVLYGRYFMTTKAVQTQQDLRKIKAQLQNYLQVNGVLPCPDTNGDGLQDRKTSKPDLCKKTWGKLPYKDIGFYSVNDPWGNPYLYAVNLRVGNAVRMGDLCEPASLFARPGSTVKVSRELVSSGNPKNQLFYCQSTGYFYCTRVTGGTPATTINPPSTPGASPRCDPAAGYVDDCVCLTVDGSATADIEVTSGAQYKSILAGSYLPAEPPYITWATQPVGEASSSSSTADAFKNYRVFNQNGDQIGGAVVAMVVSFGRNGRFTWNGSCPATLSTLEQDNCDLMRAGTSNAQKISFTVDTRANEDDQLIWLDLYEAKAALIEGDKL